MAMQSICNLDHLCTWSSFSLPFSSRLMFSENIRWRKEDAEICGSRSRSRYVCAASSNNMASPSPNYWDWWKPDKTAPTPSLSDILWPSAGAFAAMAILGKVDQLLSPKGLSMTIAPLGAVSTVLFATPKSPGARKYNVFVAQIGCAAIGVLALSAFGPGWLARSWALAASVAFMIYTRSVHPPAASLPILFIDGPKFHGLHLWYALFPGAAGCILLCLILSGKRVGIVGLGSIGLEIAKRLEAFGCIIAYNSRTKKPSLSYPYFSSVRDLAAESDAIIICCALTDETYHFINRDVLLALGKEGVVINVGRGALIDEKELVRCLLQGEIGGAGLDVFEAEPHVPQELIAMDNVVLSPHRAVLTPESFSALLEVIAGNLEAFFSSKPLLTPV